MGIKDLIVSKNIDGDYFQIHYFNFKSLSESKNGEPIECGLVLKKEVIKLEAYKIKTETRKSQQNELKDTFGIDSIGMIRSALANEMEMSIDKTIYNKFRELGEKKEQKQTRFQKFALKWFGYKPKFFVKDHEDLIRKIALESKLIATKSRVRAGNFIIVNSQLNSILQDSPIFDFSAVNKTISNGALIYKTGVISGSGIMVFVNPNLPFSDTVVIVGATTNETEQGVYVGEGEETIESIEVVDPNNLFDPKIHTEIRKKIGIISTGSAKDKFSTFEVTTKKHNLFTHLLEKIKWKKSKLANIVSVRSQ